MKIKATKTTACEVSIPLIEAAEALRHELNAHGSRAAGTNVAIPPHASFYVSRDPEDSGKDMLIFRWTETS